MVERDLRRIYSILLASKIMLLNGQNLNNCAKSTPEMLDLETKADGNFLVAPSSQF